MDNSNKIDIFFFSYSLFGDHVVKNIKTVQSVNLRFGKADLLVLLAYKSVLSDSEMKLVSGRQQASGSLWVLLAEC